MPVYDFSDSELPPNLHDLGNGPASVGPNMGPPYVPGVTQSSHLEHGRVKTQSSIGDLPYSVEEFLIPGFKALDDAMRRYWSGMRVPMKDGYRFMRVKVAGGDKSLLIWNDELVGGRARLPVGAIDRTGHEFNPNKYSPASLPICVRYPSKRGDLAVKVFRPVPFLVNYKLVIWAERKRDAEYILYQVLTRFTPLADFRMYDGKLQGTVVLKYDGCEDASDKEVGHDQHANIRYETSLTAEAWLPLPEQVVPTVLGRVTTMKEQLGEILISNIGSLNLL